MLKVKDWKRYTVQNNNQKRPATAILYEVKQTLKQIVTRGKGHLIIIMC